MVTANLWKIAGLNGNIANLFASSSKLVAPWIRLGSLCSGIFWVKVSVHLLIPSSIHSLKCISFSNLAWFPFDLVLFRISNVCVRVKQRNGTSWIPGITTPSSFLVAENRALLWPSIIATLRELGPGIPHANPGLSSKKSTPCSASAFLTAVSL